MPPGTTDQSMLDTLTPEERAAIEEVDADEQAALAKIAAGDESGTGPDGDDDEDADDSSADSKPAEPAASAPAADAAKPAAAADEQPATTQKSQQQAAYRADLPADFEARKTTLKQELTDLRTKFKAGEMELDDYEAERDRLSESQRELDTLALKAEISKDMTAQTAEQQWQAAIARQFDAAAKPESGGIDYVKDEAKRTDLDTFVRALGANPANNDKPMDWFMAEAHKRVLALHDIKPAAKAAAGPVPAAPPASRKPPMGSIPPSIAHVPGADGPGDLVSDEFADIDRLDGVELEAALARMTPAQRDKYATGV
jgi:Skp family chaperone for outer membrane proteins